ncbi:ATP-dependent RNA helicase HrpB [Pseudomonas putida NBRC 14164]|uniref:ATP-dependent RNA helicase HrpB n=1 Tax=Pseudomonas putida NBRC 14164 TaxID=1211579 RepID=A0ABN5UV95_PSEPU|nr:ATP-dependent RNA helicase HrpB [Pseudomonas putida NBRC 14164]
MLRDDPPLKIMLMSATLEGERLSRLLDDAPVVSSEGRMHPVDIRWGRPFQPGEFIEPRVVDSVLQALADQTGSVLVFLPGQAEIRRVHQSLQEALGERPEILLCPLHGELDLNAQRAAIDPAPKGQRKVVLATNIAETSLTIDGVRVVIDAGLARVPRFDPGSGMTRLDTQRISRASATQRAGRAGRLEPGVCYRLWSEAQHDQLAAHGSAEILQADLAGLALQLARWGVAPHELSWLDQPPSAAFTQAQDLLARLGAFKPGSRDNLSDHGQAMAELPAHPRIAHLLLRGQSLGLAAMACDVAALLGERDIQRGGGADLHSRLALVSGESKASRGGQGGVQRARQLARQYRGLLRGKAGAAVADPDHPRWLGALLALAYPDRVAQQRRAGGAEYRLANGRAALFGEVDALMKHPWLVIADLGSRQGQSEERIYLAAEFDPALLDDVLAEQVERVDLLDWDEREQVLRAERQTKVGELILSREPLAGLTDEARANALLGLVRRKGLNLLTWTPELRQWQARVALLRQLDLDRDGQSEWPDLGDEALLASMEDWLQPYLGKVSRLSHFSALDLPSLLRNLLPWPLPQRLEEQAPAHLAVPSGSNIRLDYSETPPILAVRLQELFGLADTPRIANGRQQVKLHLLSPARRPVQVTQDLANFWRTTYAEVKKDLKGRYPKLPRNVA